MKIQILFGNDNFSYMIFKNPDNVFERKVNSLFNVKGYFTDKNDPTSYIIQTYPNNNAFIKYCRKNNFSQYLLSEKYIISPLNIESIIITLRSAIRAEYIKNNISNKKYPFQLSISPIIVYNEDLLLDLFDEFFDLARYNMSSAYNYDDVSIGSLYLEGEEYLNILIQKMYILLYCYTSSFKYNITLPNKEKLEKLSKYTKEWLDKENKFYNYIMAKLGQNKYGKDYLKNEGNVDKKNYDYLTIQNLGNQRYFKIISMLDETDSILEIGCGSGRLARFILRHKIYIDKYYGIDINSNNIDKARRKIKRSKFKFDCANALYPDKYYYDKVNTIICTEFIEHLQEKQRLDFIQFLVDYCHDKKIILTVPNGSINNVYWQEDGYRHKDHKIEYNYDLLYTEIIKPFKDSGRNVSEICISEEFFDFNDQITYMIYVN